MVQAISLPKILVIRTYFFVAFGIFQKIIDEIVRKESSTSRKQKDDAEAIEEKSEPKVKEASTQIQSSKKNVSVQFRSKHRSKGKFRLRRMVENEYRLK